MKKILIIIGIFFVCILNSANAQEAAKITVQEDNESTTVENTQKQYFTKDEKVNLKTFPISAIDKQESKLLKNKLIIYTPLYGKSTNTDTKGYEAVVINNRVVKLNQYNSYIPEHGYVVSGHGKAKKFITDNLFIGADVEADIDKGIFKVDSKSENYLYEAQFRLDRVKNIISKTNADYADITGMTFYADKAETLLEKTKKTVQFGDFENALRMANNSMTYSDKAQYYSLVYNPNEFKAIWIFPYQRTMEEVINDFDIVKRLNVKNIIIEGFFDGNTIYKSDVAKKYGLPDKHRYYGDFDPLLAWVVAAKTEDINVYVAFNTFNVGNPDKSVIDKSVVSVYPEWQNKTKAQQRKKLFLKRKKQALKGELYLDPANVEVQKYLMELVKEVHKKYGVKGVDFKGLRYPAGDWGYTAYAKKEFTKKYHVSPEKINKKDKNYANWQNYKSGKISDFVNKLSEMQKNENIEILLNVYPDDINIKNWNINENMILCPVFNSSDEVFAAYFINDIKSDAKNAKIYPIYMDPYLEEKPRKFFDQATVARSLDAKGIILYSLDYIDKAYVDALRCAIFNPPKEKKQEHIYEKRSKK